MAAPNALVVGTLIDAINNAIVAAYGNIPIIDDEMARTYQPPANSPFATVAWNKVKIGWDFQATVGGLNQTYEFTITYLWPIPPPQGTLQSTITQQKAYRASLLIAQLQTGATFANIAIMPYVSDVIATEDNPRWDGMTQFSIKFCCQVWASHH